MDKERGEGGRGGRMCVLGVNEGGDMGIGVGEIMDSGKGVEFVVEKGVGG